MPPRPAKKAKKSTKKKMVEDEVSENLQDDDELLNMDNANQPGNEQEDLTQEQKEENMYKKLTSNNPQAPLNVTKFSYKERLFKTEDVVEQLVFHYSCDGDILVLESDEARDQDEYLDNKRSRDKQLLDKMNAAAIKEFGGDESKTNFLNLNRV